MLDIEVRSVSFTFGSLFAGIGGIDLGLERAGMTCLWQVEIDDFCRRVLHKHWPAVQKFKDVRDVGRKELAPVDLIAGGFPCQPHSVAGKRKGAKDDRNLWPEYRRIVADLRPAWVLAENVPGIRTTILDQVLSDLESLGYDFPRASTGEPVVFGLPACGLNAPHKRERLFVVAYTTVSSAGICKVVAYADSRCGQRTQEPICSGWNVAELCSQDVADTDCTRLAQRKAEDVIPNLEPAKRYTWWDFEPPLGRVVDGFPGRVDRIRALGNAVVPQVAEWIGRRILEAGICQ